MSTIRNIHRITIRASTIASFTPPKPSSLSWRSPSSSLKTFTPPHSSSSSCRRIKRRHHPHPSYATSNANGPPLTIRPLSSSSSSSSTLATQISTLRRTVSEAQDLHQSNLSSLLPTTHSTLKIQQSDLQTESSSPTFWDDPDAPRTVYVTERLAHVDRLLAQMAEWSGWSGECDAGLEILDEILSSSSSSSGLQDDDLEMATSLLTEITTASQNLLTSSQKFSLELLLTGPYDSYPATLLLTAGAGGTEACDFVSMLSRMYLRHAERMGYAVKTVESVPGDTVGYKSLTLRVDNTPAAQNAYGWFRGEKGAHRLVRLSPFNANNKRQTTFAGVDVVPLLPSQTTTSLTIPPSDLEISTMRSGGKGGQNVNKVESKVRITHTPTKITVTCAQERSQLRNREIALERLKSQLLAIREEQAVEELSAIRGDVVEAAWGAQIRNYVLQPYRMVKDGRTGWETGDAEGFLDGGDVVEDCIGVLLRERGREERGRREMEEEEGGGGV